MNAPFDIGIIDTMIGFPAADMKKLYAFITRQTKDKESQEDFEFPAEYMFKDSPDKTFDSGVDPVGVTLREMDLWGIEKGLVGVHGEAGERAMTLHPDRFIPSISVDANDGMDGVRAIQKAYETWNIRAVGLFPAGMFPQVPINDKKMYPIYAKCAELGIAVFVCAGVPGPRLKAACQHVELIDEVCYDFPDLTFVTRHGCEPWTELAVKLLLKWPNLYYSTTAFAPKYYPKDIINFANTRGADKVMFSGYFPAGLTYDRIFQEMPDVPLRDDVWPKFLRENAQRVFKLPEKTVTP
jgi:predicted TIM-barrel fold metal-dependent hydrolase